MLASFWESLGGNLSQRWLERIFGPVFAFWAGGVLFFSIRFGWHLLWDKLIALGIPLQVVILVVSLLVLIFSDTLVQDLTFPFLRFLEGYWPSPPLGWLQELCRMSWIKKRLKWENAWQPLIKRYRNGQNLHATEMQRLLNLERRQQALPADDRLLLPTELGNQLRAAEMGPEVKYGLNVTAVFPRLWLLLPEETRAQLFDSRQALDRAVQHVIWGSIFLIWGSFSLWALPVAVLWLLAGYRLSLQSGYIYASLLESVFDVYRLSLYDAVGWLRPKDSAEEKAQGELLSEFLERGTIATKINYSHPEATNS